MNGSAKITVFIVWAVAEHDPPDDAVNLHFPRSVDELTFVSSDFGCLQGN